MPRAATLFPAGSLAHGLEGAGVYLCGDLLPHELQEDGHRAAPPKWGRALTMDKVRKEIRAIRVSEFDIDQ